MPTISNSLLALIAAGLTGAAPAAAAPVSAEGCSAHLATIAPKLQESGYRISWGPGLDAAPAAPLFLEAAHVEAAGRVLIEYRCAAAGLGVTIVNQGLPDIPFHILLAAGLSATLSNEVPEWLRSRDEAMRP